MCRIGGAKSKGTRYSTVTVSFDRILQLTVLHFAAQQSLMDLPLQYKGSPTGNRFYFSMDGILSSFFWLQKCIVRVQKLC